MKNPILFTCTPRPFHPQSIKQFYFFFTMSNYVNYLPELTIKGSVAHYPYINLPRACQKLHQTQFV